VDPLVVTRHVVVPPHELQWRFSRSGGPGGQSVNTTDSRVELRYDVAHSAALSPLLRARALRRLEHRLVGGVLVVVVTEERSQTRNRRIALDRLAALLREAVAPPPAPRRATRPSRSAVERRLAAKRRRSQTKRLRSDGPGDE
jgi:ribosome-associated protein